MAIRGVITGGLSDCRRGESEQRDHGQRHDDRRPLHAEHCYTLLGCWGTSLRQAEACLSRGEVREGPEG